MAEEKKSNTLTIDLDKLTPISYIVIIILVLIVGILWTKVSNLEKGATTTTGSAVNNAGERAQPSQGIVRGKLDEEDASKLVSVTPDDLIRGNENAEVFLVEYSDLECPFCSAFHDTARVVVEDYGDQVAWVYRHFPLDSLHPQARPAAIAGECIAEAGGDSAFWAFADAVFADQEGTLADIDGTAASVGGDGPVYVTCIEGDAAADHVEQEYQDGIAAGVTGTPGNFVVNSSGEVWYIPGAVDAASLKNTIDEALEG